MSKNSHEAEIRRYQHDDVDWHRALDLRMRVLRIPLGLSFDPFDLAREKDDVHLGLFAGDQVIGSLILTKVSERSVKMRQVAVDPASQGQGVGRKLVARSEELARDLGFDEMVLNARETAVPFYKALGYEVIEEPFIEVGIPHRKMVKVL